MLSLLKRHKKHERQVVGPGAQTRVVRLVIKAPICEFCLGTSEYYGKTPRGRNAYMCHQHFHRLGHVTAAERLVTL